MKRYLLLLGGWILVIIIVIGTITILYHRHPYQKVLLPTGWKRKWFPSEARHHYLSPMMEVANGSIININIDVIVATFSFVNTVNSYPWCWAYFIFARREV